MTRSKSRYSCPHTGIIVPANRRNLWNRLLTAVAADIFMTIEGGSKEVVESPYLQLIFSSMTPEDKRLFDDLTNRLQAMINDGTLEFQYQVVPDDHPINPNALQCNIL